MSCPHVVWALRQRGLSASQRIVLIYLADRANGHMVCWPTLPTIAEAVELSWRTCQSAVHALAGKGLIRIERNGWLENRYFILRPADEAPPANPAPPPEPVASPPASVASHEMQSVQVPTCKSPPPPPAAVASQESPKKESPKKEEALTSFVPRARGSNGSVTKLGTRLPEDAILTAEAADFAAELHIDGHKIWPVFCDYWRSQPGQKGRKADWFATWRNWCRREAASSVGNGHARAPPPSKLGYLREFAFNPLPGDGQWPPKT